MTRDRQDVDDLLRDYFHQETRELSLDPTVVDRALGRAFDPDRIHIQSRWQRPWRRALSGLAGVAAVAVIGLLLMPRHPGSLRSHDFSALHPVNPASHASSAAAAGSALPSGRPALLASSSPVTLWSLAYRHGLWQVWQGAQEGQFWRESASMAGIPGQIPQLVFAENGHGWLAVDQKAGWALFSRRAGGAWRAVKLPIHAARLSLAVDAERLAVALASGQRTPTRLFVLRQSGRWVQKPARGLPSGVTSLWFSSPRNGYAEARLAPFSTADGGNTWSGPRNPQEALPVTTMTTAIAPSVDVPSAGLEHQLAILGSREWAVWAGAVWSRTQPGDRARPSFQGGWQRLSALPFSGSVRSLVFLRGGRGWMLSRTGQLWTTRDGGRTWTRAT